MDISKRFVKCIGVQCALIEGIESLVVTSKSAVNASRVYGEVDFVRDTCPYSEERTKNPLRSTYITADGNAAATDEVRSREHGGHRPWWNLELGYPRRELRKPPDE